ncbi:MAG: hypothetical protein AB7O57_21430 [Hyphomicrobiaceae bacterium]
MKTLLGSLLALGLLSTAASAQYCPPGYGSGYGYGPRTSFHRSTQAIVPAEAMPAAAPEAPVGAPIEPSPAPEAAAPAAPEAPPK